MDLSVDLELNRVVSNLDRYVHELGMDAVEVVKTQTRLLTKQLVDHAMPPDSQAQGRTAIAQDLRKVFFPINEKKFRIVVNRQGIVRIVGKGKGAKGRVADVAPELTMTFFGAMKGIHYARLNARGRVRGNRVFPNGKPKSEIQKLAIVRLSDFKKYRASLQAPSGLIDQPASMPYFHQ